MKKLFLFWFALAVSSTTYAEEQVSDFAGVIRSSGEHVQNSCGVDLELVDDTGKALDLTNADELERMHCQKEKDFQVTIKGRITPKFLFWGGNLEVSSFVVLDEQESASHTFARSPRSGPSFGDRR